MTGFMGLYTEIGVVNRREASADAIITEIRTATTKRHTALLDDPPTDADALPSPIFGGVPWTWRTLLRNRPLDVWMHEQDVRRAVGRPGNLDSAPAVHAVDYLMESLPYVVAKRAQAPAGTVVRLEVAGHDPVTAVVGDDGRGRVVGEVDGEPTVALATDRETFAMLAGGRRRPEPGAVRVAGDPELADRILGAMAVTP